MMKLTDRAEKEKALEAKLAVDDDEPEVGGGGGFAALEDDEEGGGLMVSACLRRD